MKERKVLAIYIYDNQHELVETIVKKVSRKGISIDAICFLTYRYEKCTDINWPCGIKFANFVVNKLGLTRLSNLFFRYLGYKVFEKLIDEYDIIEFMSFPPKQFPLAEYCVSKNKEYFIEFWGKDILHASRDTKIKMKKLLDCSKRICVNDQIKRIIQDFYTKEFHVDYTSKFAGNVDGVYMGNKDIEILDTLTEDDIKKTAPLFCNDYKNKIITTIGYNGISIQNQDKAIELMTQMPDELKRKLHIVLPMTYGTQPEHLNHVIELISKSGINYTVLDKFLSNKEICVLRKITDVFIMLQNTDGFAGSVRSHVYCQNVCLIGDWLEYPIDKEGIFYFRVNWDNLIDQFEDVILHFDDYHTKSLPNRDKMIPFMKWDRYIDYMCKLYK